MRAPVDFFDETAVLAYVNPRMKVSLAHLSGWLALTALTGAGTAWGQTAPAPANSGTPGNPPAKSAGDTVQLHRVVYVHAGDAGNLLQQKKFVDQYAAPPQLFPMDTAPDPQYIPPPIQFSSEEINRQRHKADDAKNWMLLTPEEILGVAPEKALDDPDRNLTAEERYIKRNSLSRMGTNDATGEFSLKTHDYFHKENSLDSLDRTDDTGYGWSRGGLNRLMGAEAQGTNSGGGMRDEMNTPASPWSTSIWGAPVAEDPAAIALKQKTEMQQFDRLLQPEASTAEKSAAHLSEVTPAAKENPFQTGPTQPATAADVFSALKDSIGRPAPGPTLFPEKKPKPTYYEEHRRKPEPPPWLNQPAFHPL